MYVLSIKTCEEFNTAITTYFMIDAYQLSSSTVSQQPLEDMLLQEKLLCRNRCCAGRQLLGESHDMIFSFRPVGCVKCASTVGSLSKLLDVASTFLLSKLPDRARQIAELIFSPNFSSPLSDRVNEHIDIGLL